MKNARRLRQKMSLPEVLLWQQLRERPGGFRFRRQFPKAPYVIDFACLERRLAIEVDGEAHDRGNRPKRDVARDMFLHEEGFDVMRIAARDVLGNLDGVVSGIVARCGELGPLRQRSALPPPRSGEDFA